MPSLSDAARKKSKAQHQVIKPGWSTWDFFANSIRDRHVTGLFKKHGGIPLPLKPMDYYLAAEYAIATWHRSPPNWKGRRAVVSFVVAMECAWAITTYSRCGAPFAGVRFVNNFPGDDMARWKDVYTLHDHHKAYMTANPEAQRMLERMTTLHRWAKTKARKPLSILVPNVGPFKAPVAISSAATRPLHETPAHSGAALNGTSPNGASPNGVNTSGATSSGATSNSATSNGTHTLSKFAKPFTPRNVTTCGPTSVPTPPLTPLVPQNTEQHAAPSGPQTVFEYAYGIPEAELVAQHATPEQQPWGVSGLHHDTYIPNAYHFPNVVASPPLPEHAGVATQHIPGAVQFLPGLQDAHVPFCPVDPHHGHAHVTPEAFQYQWPNHTLHHAYHTHEFHAAFDPHGPTMPATHTHPSFAAEQLWAPDAKLW